MLCQRRGVGVLGRVGRQFGIPGILRAGARLYSIRATTASVATPQKRQLLNEDHRINDPPARLMTEKRSAYETYCTRNLLGHPASARCPSAVETRIKSGQPSIAPPASPPAGIRCCQAPIPFKLTLRLLDQLVRRMFEMSGDQLNAQCRQIPPMRRRTKPSYTFNYQLVGRWIGHVPRDDTLPGSARLSSRELHRRTGHVCRRNGHERAPLATGQLTRSPDHSPPLR